jgi:DNA helicase-2/ATP-dependent DNA helicase PcrA
MSVPLPLDETDAAADAEIAACLTHGKYRSFFLFAGAGSGKTRSLVEALKRLRTESGPRFRLRGQRIGVITYTNAACDEIKHRIDFDPLIEVSTIHSFVWSLINGFQNDIRTWLNQNLQVEIGELNEAQAKGRSGKASADRQRKIESKQKRLALLPSITKFNYSPTGDVRGRDALNHAEVIKIGADFLRARPLMQAVLVNRFPILLVDESQDTNASLLDAFFAVQSRHKDRFALGLFGDTMQRIYTEGKAGLGVGLPSDWARPAKLMNHRSPRRVIGLINRIRHPVDQREQQARANAEDGCVRLFVGHSSIGDKRAAEQRVKQRMAEISGDPLWGGEQAATVKTLILEHLMAARRMGFSELFEPLYSATDGSMRTSLLEGTVPGLRFFSNFVLPLIKAQKAEDQFEIARIVRTFSPLLARESVQATGDRQSARVKEVRKAVAELTSLWRDDGDPRLVDVLTCVAQSGLFEIPDNLDPIAHRNPTEPTGPASSPAIDDEDFDEVLDAWDRALTAPFSQLEAYASYVGGTAPFGTHQGVKGLQFPRVLVIMDDAEARGFMFSYDKIFGVEPKSAADMRREHEGGDTSLDRTRRLLYVTCSRAQNSLALIAYSKNPARVRAHGVAQGWLLENEIEAFE